MLESTTIMTASVGGALVLCRLAMGNSKRVEALWAFVSCKRTGKPGPVYINTFCNVIKSVRVEQQYMPTVKQQANRLRGP